MAGLNGCAATIEGIGDSECITAPIMSMIKGIIPEASSHSYDSLSDFNDEDINKALVASKDLLPLKVFTETEAANFDEVTSETSSGVKIFHADMKYGLIGYMRLSPDQNRILQTYDGKIKKCYLIDGQGSRQGTFASDGTSIEGFSIEYFKISPVELNVDIDGKSFTKVEIRFSYISEFNKTPVFSIGSELDWDPLKQIKPMTKLDLTTSTVAASAFTVDVAYNDPTTGKTETYSGLDADDFEVKDENGDVVTTAVITETSVEGAYTVTTGVTTITSATIQLVASGDSLFYSDVATAAAA